MPLKVCTESKELIVVMPQKILLVPGVYECTNAFVVFNCMQYYCTFILCLVDNFGMSGSTTSSADDKLILK